jgi:hypothetical protein
MSYAARISLAGIVFLLGLVAAGGEARADAIDTLLAASPGDYVQERDRLLAGADRPALEALLASSELRVDGSAPWARRELAHILRGWMTNGRQYRTLLREPKYATPSGESVWGWVAWSAAELKGTGPLMHEILFREMLDDDALRDASVVLSRLEGHRDATVEGGLLIEGILDERRSSSDAARFWTAQAMAGVGSPRIASSPTLAVDRALGALNTEIGRLRGRSSGAPALREGKGALSPLLQLVSRVAKADSPRPTPEDIEDRVEDAAFLRTRIGRASVASAFAKIGDFHRVAGDLRNGAGSPSRIAWAVRIAGDLGLNTSTIDLLVTVFRTEARPSLVTTDVRRAALESMETLTASLPIAGTVRLDLRKLLRRRLTEGGETGLSGDLLNAYRGLVKTLDNQIGR